MKETGSLWYYKERKAFACLIGGTRIIRRQAYVSAIEKGEEVCMQIIKHDTYDSVSQAVARVIAEQVRQKPQTVLGLATGSTPTGLYRELVRLHREEGLDFSRVTTFNLDEYYGLDHDHPQSYHQYMWEHLFSHINVPKEQIHIPDGKPEDVATYCRQYETMIQEAGCIDIQVLGVGSNGHIGFNEPADELEPYTHLVRLAHSTIEANARFFSSIEDVPRSAITMGICTILKARRIVLLATGKAKAPIIRKIMNSGISTFVPASLLRLHDDVEIYVDDEAAQLL